MKIIEQYYPMSVGLISGIIVCNVMSKELITDNFKDLLLSTITICSIVVGFITTSKAILISIDNKPIINKIKSIDKYSLLIDYFMSAIRFNFIVVIYSGILIFWDISKSAYSVLFFAIWIGLIITTGLACYRVIGLFSKILKMNVD